MGFSATELTLSFAIPLTLVAHQLLEALLDLTNFVRESGTELRAAQSASDPDRDY